jgi:hypothetical protein
LQLRTRPRSHSVWPDQPRLSRLSRPRKHHQHNPLGTLGSDRVNDKLHLGAWIVGNWAVDTVGLAVIAKIEQGHPNPTLGKEVRVEEEAAKAAAIPGVGGPRPYSPTRAIRC